MADSFSALSLADKQAILALAVDAAAEAGVHGQVRVVLAYGRTPSSPGSGQLSSWAAGRLEPAVWESSGAAASLLLVSREVHALVLPAVLRHCLVGGERVGLVPINIPAAPVPAATAAAAATTAAPAPALLAGPLLPVPGLMGDELAPIAARGVFLAVSANRHATTVDLLALCRALKAFGFGLPAFLPDGARLGPGVAWAPLQASLERCLDEAINRA